MKHKKKVFSQEDHIIIESLKRFTEHMGRFLGAGCEVILNSLEDIDHSVAAIYGGENSGRHVGSPLSDLGLSLLEQLEADPELDYIEYFNKDAGGAGIKSCTMVVRDLGGEPIAFLCINLYLGSSIESIIKNFLPARSSVGIIEENFGENSDMLIRSALSRVRDEVYCDTSIPAGNINREIITRLREKGVFQFKDAIATVADQMHVSKNTVYMHLRSAKK